MEKRNKKRNGLFRAFIVIFFASYLVINWNDVSWFFNYQAMAGAVGDFFVPYPSLDADSVNDYFYINQGQNLNDAPTVKNIKTTYTDKQNTIEIPKISISAPIIFSQTTDEAKLAKDLDKGVIYYPGSVYPGYAGQILILGHSAPRGWPKIKYDWVFSNLNDLNDGDKIMINLDNRQYTYTVRKKTIIDKGAEIPAYNPSNNSKNVLTLISCFPPGKNYKRIVIQAELDDEY